jgi:hypothetical protein
MTRTSFSLRMSATPHTVSMASTFAADSGYNKETHMVLIIVQVR